MGNEVEQCTGRKLSRLRGQLERLKRLEGLAVAAWLDQISNDSLDPIDGAVNICKLF